MVTATLGTTAQRPARRQAFGLFDRELVLRNDPLANLADIPDIDMPILHAWLRRPNRRRDPTTPHARPH